MSCLAIVNRPSIHPIRKGLLEIGDRWSAYSNLDELTFVYKNLEIVSTSFRKDLGAHSSLKAITFSRFGLQTLWIQLDLLACFIDVPTKNG